MFRKDYIQTLQNYYISQHIADLTFYYLNNNTNAGLILNKENDIDINVYADASYGLNNHDYFKSQSGIIIKIGNSTIYAKSSKQNIVTKSSTEAEIVSASDGYSILCFVRNWLQEKNIKINNINLFQDNINTIKLLTNTNNISMRSKHINIRYYFLKDKSENEKLIIKYCPTNEMVADLLTKPIFGIKFINLRNKLMG